MNIKIHLLTQTKEMAVVERFMLSADLWNEHERHVAMQELDGTINIDKTDNPTDVAKACIETIVQYQEAVTNEVIFIGAQFGGTHTALFVSGTQKLCVNDARLMTCLFSDYLIATGYAHETEQNMVVSSIENIKPTHHAEHLMATSGNPDNPPRIDRKPRQKRKGDKKGVA